MELGWLETVRLIGVDLMALIIVGLFGLDLALPRLRRWRHQRGGLLPESNRTSTAEDVAEPSYPPPQWLDRSSGRAGECAAVSSGTSESPHPGTRHAA